MFRRWLDGSQIVRVTFGIVLIILGLQVRRADEYFQHTAKAACDVHPDVWCQFYQLAFATVGLGGFWALLLVSGAYYAMFYDWVMPSVERLAASIVDKVVETVPIVLQRIRNNALKQDDLKTLLLAIFKHSAGVADPDGEGLGQFVSDQLLYKRLGLLWRRRHSTQVRIEELADPILGQRFLRWNEDTAYEIVSGTIGAPFDLGVLGWTPCAPEAAFEIAAHLHFKIRVGSQMDEFDGASLALIHPAPDLASGYAVGQFSVRHADSALVISYARRVRLTARETAVSVSEKSLLPRSDRDFTKFNLEPTRGMLLNFNMPPGFRITSTYCCLKAYQLPDAVRPTSEITLHDDCRTARLDTDSWILPGVAFTVVWKPATD